MAREDSVKIVKEDEVTIKELFLKLIEWYKYLLNKWVIILVFGLLGGVLGLAYSYFGKTTYTASTTFVLEGGESSGGLGQYAGLASMMGFDFGNSDGGGIFQGDNILELYKSRNMIERALLTSIDIDGKRQLLIEKYIDFNELREIWDKKPNLKNLNFEFPDKHSTPGEQRLRDSVLGKIVEDINKSNLSVSKPDKKLNIIRVDVRAEDEVFAKIFNDEIVKNVNDFYVQTKTKKSLNNVAILARKTDSVRAVMNGAIYNAALVADETPNLNPTKQVQRIAPMQRSQFTAETNKAILSELVKNLEMSKISLLKETPLIQVVDKPVYPLFIQRVGKAKGIVLGGLIAGFLTVLALLVNKLLRTIMA